jgi:hypothetical protein
MPKIPLKKKIEEFCHLWSYTCISCKIGPPYRLIIPSRIHSAYKGRKNINYSFRKQRQREKKKKKKKKKLLCGLVMVMREQMMV